MLALPVKSRSIQIAMEAPFPAYDGDDPYIFVSYAHEDVTEVYPDLQWLRDQGVNIWYDEGISPGSEWREELGRAIRKSKLMVFFVSPESVHSLHCRREVTDAVMRGGPRKQRLTGISCGPGHRYHGRRELFNINF